MKLLVLEGIDGSGKSTQLNLIRAHFEDVGLKYKYLHFPRTESPVFGELVSMFLRGEFGNNEQVSPYLVAILYAGDRHNASSEIRKWLSEGYYVLLDRYVNSNVAFQCAKISSAEEKAKLREWILNAEYNYFGIPRPDVNLFLDVPFEFTEKRLLMNRTGDDREYLKGAKDVHEENLDFQKSVRQEYLALLKTDPASELIDCSLLGDSILPASEIHKKVIAALKRRNVV